ncbi:MAG: hybrid sensor histidine kinase/response regulator [Flavobacteriales bacterium]
MNERAHIIYVDDEPDNLIAFKANFRTDYDIFTTTSVAEAVEYMKKHEVKVVFSDQMMPEVTGVEFFETIRPDFPETVRVLVTGHSDMHAVVDAINKGEIYRYIPKPWDNMELKVCIENCIEKYDRDRELKQKNIDLEKALSELEKFVYSASHDLRAPITTIKGVLNVARLEKDDMRAVEYFDMIERSTDKLNDFVTNIIHYYQNMKSDEMLEVIDVEKLVNEVVEKNRMNDSVKTVTIEKNIATSGIFKADAHRLRMVLNNVIGNAIRYHDKSKQEPLVQIQVVQNTEQTVFRISDNGIGIDKELLPHIFDMFTKSDANNVGAGVGLYIAREATKKMNGQITVSSNENEGSRFTIVIPNKA